MRLPQGRNQNPSTPTLCHEEQRWKSCQPAGQRNSQERQTHLFPAAEQTQRNEPWKGKETSVTPGGDGAGKVRGGRGRHCPALYTYPAGSDLSAGRARKSQRKMASPTLMTCRWSGVKATWRTGSEWPMYTWEKACLELLHHHACPIRTVVTPLPAQHSQCLHASAEDPLRGQHHTYNAQTQG